MVSLGVHPSSSAKHKFQESWNVNGSDSVTQNYPEVCQQGHRSVTGCNIDPDSTTYCHQFECSCLDSWTSLPNHHSPHHQSSCATSSSNKCYAQYERHNKHGQS